MARSRSRSRRGAVRISPLNITRSPSRRMPALRAMYFSATDRNVVAATVLFDLRLLFGEGRVATLLGLVKRRGCCLPGGGQRHRPQAELPRLAPKPESGRKALIAARLDDQVKAGATRIGDFPPHWSGLQVFYGKVG